MRSRKLAAAVAIAIAALLAFIVSRSLLFYYRDNFSTHLPVKFAAASALRHGHILYWNDWGGGGQPLAGNPNFLTFYPDNVLYLLTDAFTAFNLHFILHLALAALAMQVLLRALGSSPRLSWIGATLYVCSGVVTSTTAFYNLVVAAALIPLALALLHRLLDAPSHRRALQLGVAWGLLGLIAEPVMIASVAVASLVLAAGRMRAVATRWFTVGVVALVVAAPQLLAFREIAGGTERAMRQYSANTVLAASLPPWRVLEMLVGPFFGTITNLSPNGYAHAAPTGAFPVLFISLFVGPLLLVSLLQKSEGISRRYQWLACAALFIALGRWNPIVTALTEALPQLRTGRYPEKLALPFTVFIVVLGARWLGREANERRDRVLLWMTFGVTIGSVVYAFAHGGNSSGMRAVSGALFVTAFVVVALTLSGHRRLFAEAAVAIVALAACSAATIPLDVRAPYTARDARWDVLRGARVAYYAPLNPGAARLESARDVYRLRAAAQEPLFGATNSIRYALDSSPEGLYSMFTRIAWERARRGDVETFVKYARLQACEFVASRKELRSTQLAEVTRIADPAGAVMIYRVASPLSLVSVPRRTHDAASVADAVRAIESASFDVMNDAVVPPNVQSAGDCTVHSVSRGDDSIRFVADCRAASVAVVNESFFHGWRARAGGASLQLFPADFDRIGVLVPKGRHEVTVTFGTMRGPIAVTWIVSIATVLLAMGLALRDSLQRGVQTVSESSSATASPAR